MRFRPGFAPVPPVGERVMVVFGLFLLLFLFAEAPEVVGEECVEAVRLDDGCGPDFLAEEADVAEGDEGLHLVFVRVVFGEDGVEAVAVEVVVNRFVAFVGFDGDGGVGAHSVFLS